MQKAQSNTYLTVLIPLVPVFGFCAAIAVEYLVFNQDISLVNQVPKSLLTYGVGSILSTGVLVIITRIIAKKTEHLAALAVSEDPVTGCHNRNIVLPVLDQAILEAKRKKTAISVILLRIDYFHKLNESFGRHTAQELLRMVASCLKQNVRDSDTIFKWESDEFLVILKECQQKDADKLALKIRGSIADTPVMHKKKTLHVTVSIGGAVLTGETGDSSVDLLKRAATGRDMAQKDGGNQYVFEQRWAEVGYCFPPLDTELVSPEELQD